MKRATILASLFAVAFAGTLPAAPKTFQADPAHSGITFKIRHFFTTVPGSFGEFNATIQYDAEDVSSSSAKAEIQVGSVDTNNDKRDAHLKDEDFFHTAENPVIVFESTKWEKTDEENEFKVTGDLTMAGQTQEVVLDVTLLGTQENNDGVLVSGWEAETTIDRRDWGISYGQGIVGNEVEIEIFVQAPEA